LIRPANPERDGAACAALYAPNVDGSPVSFEEVAPSAGEMSERIARFGATHPWLVLEEDGEVVGYAYSSPHRSRRAYRWAVDVAIYVAAERRGRGRGRALYEELIERLRDQCFHVACAGIALPNDASVALHERLGFVPVGVYRRIGWKAGAWRDVGWWQLELAPAGERPPPEPLPRADG
jgi:phosphinothricin acetyltransferase